MAFYGPTDKRASKAVLGIFITEGDEGNIHRYFSEEKDARHSKEIFEDVIARLREHEVKSLVLLEKIFGCPHEEGVDYEDGGFCPECLFWKDKDRYESIE